MYVVGLKENKLAGSTHCQRLLQPRVELRETEKLKDFIDYAIN